MATAPDPPRGELENNLRDTPCLRKTRLRRWGPAVGVLPAQDGRGGRDDGGLEEPMGQLREASRPWSLRARKMSDGNRGCERRKRNKTGLTVHLTVEDLEEDIFAAVTGLRPRRRPKKRPSVVQRLIDVSRRSLFYFVFLFSNHLKNVILVH